MVLFPVPDEATGVGGGVLAQLALESLLEPGLCVRRNLNWSVFLAKGELPDMMSANFLELLTPSSLVRI